MGCAVTPPAPLTACLTGKTPCRRPRRESPQRRLFSRRKAKTSTPSQDAAVNVAGFSAAPTPRRRRRRRRRREAAPPSPVNMYVGADFTVRLGQWFEFERLIRDAEAGGVVHTDFRSFRRMRSMELSAGGERMRSLPNAGGSSEISEILSYEMLRRCFGAQLVKTEMEVEYFPEGGSITDMVVRLFGAHDVGVSVTRAFKYATASTPRDAARYTEEDALRLLNKKLQGVVQSSRNTLHKWGKQILHVWAPDKDVANVVARAYASVAPSVRANTVVMVTTAHDAPEIFTNK